MNRTMPSRDLDHRGPDLGGASRSTRTLPRAIGLVCGAAHSSAKRTTPPGFSRRRSKLLVERSMAEGVAANSVLSFRRCHLGSGFLRQRTCEEPSDGMRLPSRRLHQFLDRCSSGTLQQLNYSVRLGSRPGCRRLALGSGALSAFGFRFHVCFTCAAVPRHMNRSVGEHKQVAQKWAEGGW